MAPAHDVTTGTREAGETEVRLMTSRPKRTLMRHMELRIAQEDSK
jgi:hypothetical protein